MAGAGAGGGKEPALALLKAQGDLTSTSSPDLQAAGLLPPSPPEQLSGVAVVIIIAVGVQTIVMLFIFAKRQVMRFALRNRRGPHVSVGQGSMKQLRREIDRRLDYVSHVTHEPQLGRAGQAPHPDSARIQAVDRVLELDTVMAKYDPAYSRPPGAPLRSFLTECLAGPLVGGDPRLIHRFSDLYQAARHSYRAFGEVEQRNFHNLLLEIRSLVASNTADRPRPVKKAVTPQHRKALNRPRRRLAGGCGEQGDRTVAHRNSTAVLISADALAASSDSTPV